jgi:hypothetical protein
LYETSSSTFGHIAPVVEEEVIKSEKARGKEKEVVEVLDLPPIQLQEVVDVVVRPKRQLETPTVKKVKATLVNSSRREPPPRLIKDLPIRPGQYRAPIEEID